jgi:DinB superfamily
MSNDAKSPSNDQARLQSYLAAQSAKLSADEIRERIESAAAEFLGMLDGITDAAAHTRPATGEWSIADILDHLTLTMQDAAGIIRTLAAGKPAQAFQDHQPRPGQAAQPVAELLARLRQTQAGVSEFLAAQGAEPNTEVRVAESYFGEITWKGYALILRLHYRDHAEQVRKTLAAVAPSAPPRR